VINKVSKRTATNDLSDLVEIFKLFGSCGASVGTYYVISTGGQKAGIAGKKRAKSEHYGQYNLAKEHIEQLGIINY